MIIIRSYSREYFKFTLNTWNLNIISLTRSYHLPHESFIPIDLKKFNEEFEKIYLSLYVSEESENYSYS